MDESHPVLRQRGFILNTGPLREFAANLDLLQRAGELSLNCYGSFRSGKTTAREYVAKKHSSRHVVISTILERQQQASRIDRFDFWTGFATSDGPRLASGSPAIAYARLVNWIRARAEDVDSPRVFVLIDESQYLTPQHGAMLKRFVDELIAVKLAPFVLLFGSAAVEQHPAALQRVGMSDVVDRFYTRWHRFRGIRLAEIPSVLRMYDRPLADRATSFSEDFAGPAFERGWRLETDARAFGAEFAHLNRELCAPHPDEVPTKFLTTAVRLYLLKLHEAGEGSKPDEAWIRECVHASGIAESLRAAAPAPRVARHGAPRSRRHGGTLDESDAR
jgi:hypothetical protein